MYHFFRMTVLWPITRPDRTVKQAMANHRRLYMESGADSQMDYTSV